MIDQISCSTTCSRANNWFCSIIVSCVITARTAADDDATTSNCYCKQNSYRCICTWLLGIVTPDQYHFTGHIFLLRVISSRSQPAILANNHVFVERCACVWDSRDEQWRLFCSACRLNLVRDELIDWAAGLPESPFFSGDDSMSSSLFVNMLTWKIEHPPNQSIACCLWSMSNPNNHQTMQGVCH